MAQPKARNPNSKRSKRRLKTGKTPETTRPYLRAQRRLGESTTAYETILRLSKKGTSPATKPGKYDRF